MSAVLMRLFYVYSVQEIREIPHEERRRAEVILRPTNERYLFDPASTEDDDGEDVLEPDEADCSCCTESGRWIREFDDAPYGFPTADLLGTDSQVLLSASGEDVLVGDTDITLSLPQNIHTAATPTFASLTLSGLAAGRVVITDTGGLLATDAGLTYDAPADKLTITSTSGAQLRLAYTAGSVYTDILAASDGDLVLNPTGGEVRADWTVAADRYLSIYNNSNSAGAYAVLRCQVGGTSADDPFMQFVIAGGATWGFGPDNSVSDQFCIFSGSTPGSGNLVTITTAGLTSVIAGDFYVTRDQASASVIGKIENTNSATASAHATLFLVSTGAVGGDSRVLYQTDGTNWVHGIDNDTTGNRFVISASASLGTTNVMAITTGGLVGLGSGLGSNTPTGILHVYGASADSHIRVEDTTALAAGIGGAITLIGVYTGTTTTEGALIRAKKTNATDGNYSFGLSLQTRPNGGSMTERVLITDAGQIEGMDGSASAPTYAFLDRPNYGMYLNDASPFQIAFTLGGAAKVSIDTTNNELRVTSSTAITWAGGGDPTSGAGDVRLIRDGAGNTLALKNGTAAQTYRIYGDATKYGSLSHNATDFVIGTSTTGGRLVLQAQSGNSWLVLSTGHLTTVAAGGQDLGDSTNTVRTGYFDTSVRIGTGATPAHILGATDVVWNEQGADVNERWEGDTLPYLMYLNGDATLENIAFFGTAEPGWQTMDRGFHIGNVSTEPTGNPTSGHFYYSNNGGPKWWDTSGGTMAFLDGKLELKDADAGGIVRVYATDGAKYTQLYPDGINNNANRTFSFGAQVTAVQPLNSAGAHLGTSGAEWKDFYAVNGLGTASLTWASSKLVIAGITATLAFHVDVGRGIFDEDVAIGTTTFPSAGSGKVLIFGDNAGNPTMGAGTGGIFCKDVAGVKEMFAIDSGSAANQLTAHNPLTGEWWINTYFFKEKKQKTFHVERFLRDLVELVPEIKSKIAIEDYWDVKEMEELV